MPIEVAPAGAPRTFRLAGELDLLNAQEVEAKLELDSRGQGDLVLDLSDLAFIDSSGIRVLIRTAERLEGRGRLILRSPNRQVQVVLSLVGVAHDGSGIVVEGAQEPEWGTAGGRAVPPRPAGNSPNPAVGCPRGPGELLRGLGGAPVPGGAGGLAPAG